MTLKPYTICAVSINRFSIRLSFLISIINTLKWRLIYTSILSETLNITDRSIFHVMLISIANYGPVSKTVVSSAPVPI